MPPCVPCISQTPAANFSNKIFKFGGIFNSVLGEIMADHPLLPARSVPIKNQCVISEEWWMCLCPRASLRHPSFFPLKAEHVSWTVSDNRPSTSHHKYQFLSRFLGLLSTRAATRMLDGSEKCASNVSLPILEACVAPFFFKLDGSNLKRRCLVKIRAGFVKWY